MTRHYSIAVRHTHSATPLGNVAKIFTHRRFSLDRLREDYRNACADLVSSAFAGPSRHATAKNAHQVTGEDPSTFTRIMAKQTATPDPNLMAFVSAIYHAKTGRESPVMALWAKVASADL